MIFAADITSAVSLAECEELARLAEGKVVLELGCQTGRSTIALASTARRVHTVDAFLEGLDVLSAFTQNLDRYQLGNVILHVGDWDDVTAGLKPDFEGIFVDAGHGYDEVLSQLTRAIHLMRDPSTAWYACHDYGRDITPGVQRAMDFWCQAASGTLGQTFHLIDTLAVVS